MKKKLQKRQNKNKKVLTNLTLRDIINIEIKKREV